MRNLISPAERSQEHSILENHAARTYPELGGLETHLCCAIEGIDKDKILIRFTHIDHDDPRREFSVVIDVSSRVYKGTFSSTCEWPVLNNSLSLVPTTSPVLPNLPILLDELNETRDLYAFIKQVRQAFDHVATQGR